MPDEITNPSETTIEAAPADPVIAAPAPAPEARAFTQDQVNAIVQDRLAKDRAIRPAAQPAKPADRPADKSTDSDLRAELEEMKLRNAFDKRAAKFDISDSASERLFKLYKAERPEDTSAWFDVTATEFGLKAPTVSNPNPGANSANTAPAIDPVKPPAAAPVAPTKVDPITSAGVVDIFNLSDAQVSQLGPAGLRAEYEKILKVGQQQMGAPPRPKAAPRT